MASSRAGSLLQGIVVGHKSVIPLRSKVGASPAREGGLPSTINFRHAIKNRKLSLPGFAGSKDRSLQQSLQIIGMDGAQVAIFPLLPVSISSLSHKSSRSGKIILPNAQGSTISQCTVRKNDPHSLRLWASGPVIVSSKYSSRKAS